MDPSPERSNFGNPIQSDLIPSYYVLHDVWD